MENSLDEALFRRFDDVFAVPLPGKNEIEHLLSLTLSGVERAKDIDWDDIVNRLTGASAAYVVRVAQAAAKSAVLSGKKLVEQSNLEAAISELKLPSSNE
jgi:ATP-dependent 26S proteasome regulatory subunit